MTAAGGEAARSVDIDLVISDMDGTLVTPDKVLTPRAIEAVRRLGAAGIGFSLISARPPRGMAAAAKTLAVRLPIGAFNGGTLIAADQNLIQTRRLPADLARPAIALLESQGVQVWVFADDGWRLRDPNGVKVDRERHTVGFDPTVVDGFEDVIDRIDKIVGVSDDHPRLQALEAEAQALWGGQATIHRSQPFYLDITHRQANKGDGVLALCAQIGVAPARTAVLGDMYNDLSMFKVAGLSIAMGQAPQAVKDQANLVTGPNTEDGFAEAIERLLKARAGPVGASVR